MLKNHSHAIIALTLFTLIVSAYLVMACFYPAAYIWATYEDLYGEWGQTYSYGIACLFSVLLAFMRSRYRWFFAVLALACLYVFMEEISWGQRLIGFDTPDLLKRYNLQREANIHNLLVGPISTTTKDIVEYTLASALLLYGVFYPLLLKIRWRFAQWFDHKGLAAPPLYLAPFFLTAAWLELTPFSFNEAEIAEILVGSSLAIMSAHYWVSQRRQLEVHDASRWPEGTAPRLALMIVAIIAGVGLLAVATTKTIYADPDKRAKIDSRLLNGHEKFAKRYTRFDRPDIAVELLEYVHRWEPNRTSVLRRIAKLYKQLGDDAKSLAYNQKALDISLRAYAENPDKRSTNLSLSRTYLLLGDSRKSHFHADHAHEMALAKVRENPDSANDAYWLAKTYRVNGNRTAALAEYKRAFELKPGSTKYRRAYYSMRRQVPEVQNEDDEAQPGPDA